METVVLGLGSNRSFNDFSPVELLAGACTRLSDFIADMNYSSIYKTGAMYVENQEDFYNMVVTGKFEDSPEKLLEKIHEVESFFGRNRSIEYRNGPRSLDIDIEMFGNLRINKPDLIIPHERMTERAFVLVPFLEVLSQNADELNIDTEFYKEKLKNLKDQKIILHLDCSSFVKML